MDGRFAPFRRIKDFFGNDLPRKLAQLEQNVLDKLDSDNARAHGPFTITDVRTRSCRAQPWELVRYDPRAGTMRIVLPSPREPKAGWILLKNVTSSVVPVTVQPIAGTVDLQTSLSLTAPYASLFLVPDRASNNWMALRASSDPLAPGSPGDVLTTDALGNPLWAQIVNANVDAAAAIEVSKLEAGNDGDTLQTVAGVPTWTSGATGGSWETVYEPDLINASNFTYAVDGDSHTIDGVDWVVDNIGAGVIEFVNGTGFRIRNGSSSAFVATNGNLAPYVILPLGSVFQLAAMRGINAPLRIQFQFTLNNGYVGDNFQMATLGVIAEVSSADHLAEFALIGYSSGNVLRAFAANGGSDVVDVPVGTWTTEDVAEVRIDANWSADFRFGTYSGGWPEVDSARCMLVHSGQKSSGLNESFLIVSDDSSTWPIGLRSTHVYIGSQRAGGSQFDLIISRLRIQQWNDGS